MPPTSELARWCFLVDENLPARLTDYLRAEGYAAEHAYMVDDERKVQTSETLIELAILRLLLARLGRQA